MRFLERERATVAKLLPGLDESLRAAPLMELEGPDTPGIQLFRDSGGSGLLVPSGFTRGLGATALDALRVQRALGSRTPSLAVATTWHHFWVATLVDLDIANNPSTITARKVASAAYDERLVAFCLAEERPGAGMLSSSLTAMYTDDGWLINGVTRPCSLARSLDPSCDWLAVMVTLPSDGEYDGAAAMALVSPDAEGLSVSGAGAESEQATLDNVVVDWTDLMIDNHDVPVDIPLTAGFVWFQLLMTGSYLGAASALVERVLLNDQVPESERVRLLVEAELAMSAAEGVASRIDAGDPAESTLADALYVRYGVQDTLARIVPRAVDLLGHLGSTASDEVAHLATFTNGLAQQPPTQSQMAGPLAAYLAGGPLTLA
ncbi:hypothetical protein ACIBQ1_51305 [Nonomuraea sp. NPDC050153]|uniref:hypothetical protein n=1 Tax=Nonomuraea sp. NPDC050153 TaxID=3364359 RepID=UPI00378D7D65